MDWAWGAVSHGNLVLEVSGMLDVQWLGDDASSGVQASLSSEASEPSSPSPEGLVSPTEASPSPAQEAGCNTGSGPLFLMAE